VAGLGRPVQARWRPSSTNGASSEWPRARCRATPWKRRCRSGTRRTSGRSRPRTRRTRRRYDLLRQYVKRFGGEKLISYSIRDTFGTSEALMGLNEYLIAYKNGPEFIRKLHEMTTDWVIAVAKEAVDAGADMIIVNSDLAYKDATFVPSRPDGGTSWAVHQEDRRGPSKKRGPTSSSTPTATCGGSWRCWSTRGSTPSPLRDRGRHGHRHREERLRPEDRRGREH